MNKISERLCANCPSNKDDYCGRRAAGTQDKCELLGTLKKGFEIGRRETTERAVRWYCTDCSCNDNCCADHKCLFHELFTKYLNGDDAALPPADDNRIFKKFRRDYMESAEKWLTDNAGKYVTTQKTDIRNLIKDLHKELQRIYITI